MSNFNHKTKFYFLSKLIHMYATVISNLNLERLSYIKYYILVAKSKQANIFLKTLENNKTIS